MTKFFCCLNFDDWYLDDIVYTAKTFFKNVWRFIVNRLGNVSIVFNKKSSLVSDYIFRIVLIQFKSEIISNQRKALIKLLFLLNAANGHVQIDKAASLFVKLLNMIDSYL